MEKFVKFSVNTSPRMSHLSKNIHQINKIISVVKVEYCFWSELTDNISNLLDFIQFLSLQSCVVFLMFAEENKNIKFLLPLAKYYCICNLLFINGLWILIIWLPYLYLLFALLVTSYYYKNAFWIKTCSWNYTVWLNYIQHIMVTLFN